MRPYICISQGRSILLILSLQETVFLKNKMAGSTSNNCLQVVKYDFSADLQCWSYRTTLFSNAIMQETCSLMKRQQNMVTIFILPLPFLFTFNMLNLLPVKCSDKYYKMISKVSDQVRHSRIWTANSSGHHRMVKDCFFKISLQWMANLKWPFGRIIVQSYQGW